MITAVKGKGVMSLGAEIAGAEIAGPKAARSAASPILRTGRGNAGVPELPEIKKIGANTKGSFEKLKKILDVFQKASPMLAQQLVIINKSLMLFLRPIGDIMAKFVRPMALWLIKVAMKWNSLFGTAQGDNKGPGAKEDALDQAKKDLTAAQMRKDPEGIAAAQDKINTLSTPDTGTNKLKEGADNLTKSFDEAYNKMSFLGQAGPVFAETAANFWDTIIPASLITLWDSMKASASALWDALKALWDVLSPIIIPLWDLVKALGGAALFAVVILLTGAFKALEFVFIGIKTVCELVMVAVTLLWEGLKLLWNTVLVPLGTFIGGVFNTVFTTLWDTLKTIYTFIKDVFLGVWTSLYNGIASFVNSVISVINKIPGVNIKKVATKAVGGPVQATGLYNLHAGERIMTAGDTARSKSTGAKTSINNYITLNAQVSSDIDIKTLARKLAEYSETELRRRVSYT